MHLIVDGYNVIRQSPRLQFLDVMDLQAQEVTNTVGQENTRHAGRHGFLRAA